MKAEEVKANANAIVLVKRNNEKCIRGRLRGDVFSGRWAAVYYYSGCGYAAWDVELERITLFNELG